jgi:4-amino-4-deoxy-L-arabinose transferase-like glycosyltransferase
MSKPVLTFWLEAGAMAVLGVRTGPDQVLSGAGGVIAAPEWAVRLPAFLFALVGTYILQRGAARVAGRRAGLLGAIVLWTMPGFALLSHQAMTDMFLVAAVAASLGLLLEALATEDDVVVTRHIVRIAGRDLELHAGHALALAVALVTLPQILLLLSLHVHVDGSGLHLGPDRLVAGSPHACALPGQPPCSLTPLAHPRLLPMLQASLWAIPTVWLVTRAAAEERVSRLLALAAWLSAALAAMAKGPAGLVIPAAAALVHVAASRSLRAIRMLEIPAGVLLAVTMIGPWYLAIYARHGRVFLDELVLRHMLGRTLDHLHDTNEGEDVGLAYFVRQLGYATFPWGGLVLAGTFATAPIGQVLSRGQIQMRMRMHENAGRALLFGAAIVSFTLVSMMKTKFHHYVLIALPPLSMLAGVWLDDALPKTRSDRALGARGGPAAAHASVGFLAAACVALVVGEELASGPASGPARFILLLTYKYSRTWVSTRSFAPAFGAVTVLAVVTLVASAWPRARWYGAVGLALTALGLAGLLLDRYLPGCASDGGQRGVLTAYYRDRGPNGPPLVAYQLNWKGENFYTGNNLAIFVSSGAPMKAYLDRRRERAERTVYFVTERGRVRVLESELGPVRSFTELTGPAVSSEFTLVRVEL